MCLLIFAHRACSDLPLVVSANRDEFHGRATAPAQFWQEHPQLLAGRDLEQGGTWMGVTRAGRFAAITNYRDPSRTAPAPRSRGELPLDYLVGDRDPRDYMHDLVVRAGDYAGFNLLLDAVNYIAMTNPDSPIVAGLLDMGRHVYLCTNGLRLAEFVDRNEPHPHLYLNVHLDGMEKTHDMCVEKEGVFREAVDGIKAAKEAGLEAEFYTFYGGGLGGPSGIGGRSRRRFPALRTRPRRGRRDPRRGLDQRVGAGHRHCG